MKKIIVLILVGGILYFDWKILKDIFQSDNAAYLEMEYLKLFGSVSVLATLLYLIDRQK